MNKYAEVNKACFEAGYKQTKVKAIWGFTDQFCLNGAYAAMVFYGAHLVEKGEITVGDITSFLLYMWNMRMNFFVIGFTFGTIFKVLGASEKMVEMM